MQPKNYSDFNAPKSNKEDHLDKPLKKISKKAISKVLAGVINDPIYFRKKSTNKPHQFIVSPKFSRSLSTKFISPQDKLDKQKSIQIPASFQIS